MGHIRSLLGISQNTPLVVPHTPYSLGIAQVYPPVQGHGCQLQVGSSEAAYLEGQVDVVGRSTMGIFEVITCTTV